MNRAFLISRQTTGVARYLSLDWIDAVAAEIDRDDGLRTLAADPDVAVGITQVVTDGPEGDIVYHLQVGDSTVGFAAGAADPEDVRMEQTWETAVAVATGELNAQAAFINGHIRLFGEQERLLAAQPIFAALDSVFTTVAESTEYA